MKEKRIVFVMTSLRTGGISTSIINLLNELASRTNYSLTLLLFDKKSANGIQLDNTIHIMDAGALPGVIALSQGETKQKSILLAINRLLAGGIAKFISQSAAYKFLFRKSKIQDTWDIAISCTQSSPLHHLYGGCNEFVLDKLKASKKYAFIHCDYITYGLASEYSRNIYARFDGIAAVSNSVRERFLEAEPSFANKTYTVYNCHDYRRIEKLANENPIIYNQEILNFVTMARLGKEKGHYRVLKAMSQLNKEGLHFKWHVVGGGDEQTTKHLQEYVAENKLDNEVIFYGDQKNPYRYIKNAQALLVPSFHEAAPMVYGEAQLLGVPIITTNTVSSLELVQDKKAGVVCENTDYGLYSILKNIVLNPDILTKYAFCEHGFDSNTLALNQFNELIISND